MPHISDIALYRFQTPLTVPVTLDGGRRITERRCLLIRVTSDDGATGWGEAAPLPGLSPENVEDVIGLFRSRAAQLVGRPEDSSTVGLLGASGEECPSARCALDLALLDLRSQRSGKSIASLIHPEAATSIRLAGLLSGAVIDRVSAASDLVARGFRALKVKVGRGEVEDDIRMVEGLRSRLGPAVALRMDANRAWTWNEALRFARAVAPQDVEFVEEPLVEADRLPDLVRETGLRVALDETMRTVAPEDLPSHSYAAAVILKPTVLGGILRASELGQAATAAGVAPVVSSFYETGIGSLGAVELAMAVGSRVHAQGLGTHAYLESDVLAGLRLDGPIVKRADLQDPPRRLSEVQLREVNLPIR